MDRPLDKQRKVLGKGLSALLPAKTPPVLRDHPEPPKSHAENHLFHLPLDKIDPNPLQPRTVFDPKRLEELSASIEANGIIQPLIVRRKNDRYELVAGERRLRAAKLANLPSVPALIQDYADSHILEVALVENIQREDLNPIETAQALDRLGRELNLSHEEIGRRTGKDRVTVTNLLRLLRLPEQVQVLLAEHRLQMGHARAILALTTPEEQIQFAEKAAAQGYSVREVERLVHQATKNRPSDGVQASNAPKEPKPIDPNVAAAIRELETALGTRVRIVERTNEKGTIEIEYYSQDDLNRIYDLIVSSTRISQ